MDNEMRTETAPERAAGDGSADGGPGGLTIESLLDRIDGVRTEMLSMRELLSTMENIACHGGEDDAGRIAEAASQAFIARETTCQKQLGFLERIYGDHFSPPSGEERTARTRMILDSMNDVIPSLDYSNESGSGSIEALRVLRELYGGLLKQI